MTNETDIKVSREEIFDQLKQVLIELFEFEEDAVVLDADLYEDLDIDSIDAVDLMVKLKEITGRKLDPEAFKQVRSVSDIVDALSGLLND